MLALAGVLTAVWYAAGVRRLRRRGHRWAVGRSISFAGASLAFVAAAVVGLASDTSFTAHVVEHLLLGMVAPALLALAAPVTLALQASSRPRQRALLSVVHSRPLAFASHPLVASALFVGSMFVLYLSPLLTESVERGWLHALVHLHFLAAGCIFFWPLLSPDPVRRRLPHPARLLVVLLTVPAHAVLGVALSTATAPVAPDVYADVGAQRAAGGVLWAAGDLLGLIAAGVVLAQWMRADEREGAREDRRLAASSAVI